MESLHLDKTKLASLTSNIEKKLKVAQVAKHKIISNGKSRGRPTSALSVTTKRQTLKHRSVRTGNAAKGKKRDAEGAVRNAGLDAKISSRQMAMKKTVDENSDSQAKLLQEIVGLGGTEEDLALVRDIGSDSEVGWDEKDGGGDQIDKLLRKDIAHFIKASRTEGDNHRATMVQDHILPTHNRLRKGKHLQETRPKNKRLGSVSPLEHKPTHLSRQQNAIKLSAPKAIFEPRPDWHTAELPALPVTSSNIYVPSNSVVKRLHEFGLQLLQAENDRYSSAHISSSSSHRFLSTIMSSGTLSDKISALTLLIQESPLHTTKAIENLVALARKRSRGQAVNALGALKDLLAQGELLPAARKLRVFASQPELLEALLTSQTKDWRTGHKLPGDIQEIHLVVWAFEDWLKSLYYEVVQLLEIWCNDEVDFARTRALGYVYELLTRKPEQEANLLRLLVNKLGDLDRKIASKASFLLLQLETEHPLMKPIIVSNIEAELLFRPRQSFHARYCAINTLNQTVLSVKEEYIAVKLLEIYFAMFVALLKRSEDTDGLHRANSKLSSKQGKIQNTARKGGRTPGKMSSGVASMSNAEVESTEKMTSAVLTGINRALPYAKSADAVVQTHLDTLFKITHSSNFNTSVQALMLLQQLSVTKQLASDRYFRTLYESLLDPRLLTSSKQAMYLNLLFRSLKADLNIKRVRAFVKRLTQMITLHQPAFACGALYLIKELEETFPSLQTLIDQPNNSIEDSREIFHDVLDESLNENGNTEGHIAPTDVTPEKSLQNPEYDPRKRDPVYSNAEWTCLWELIPFLVHFHPSVTLFATRLLHNEAKPPKPDLSLHTLIHFLDRFVYRNVKTTSTPRGASLMQPLPGDNDHGILLSKRDISRAQPPLNAADFLAKNPEEVSVDEVFFHNYFSQVGKRKKLSGGKLDRKAKKSEQSESDNDNDNDEIWEALAGSKPELQDSEDEDEDLNLDDLDSSGDEDNEVDNENVPSGSSIEDMQSDDNIDSDIHEEETMFPDEDGSVSGQDHEPADTSSSRRQKRRKLRHLPTFASVDDYADMLAGEEDGMD